MLKPWKRKALEAATDTEASLLLMLIPGNSADLES